MILSLAYRNAARNRRRTALTAATVLLGTAMLTVALAWMNGMFTNLLGAVRAQGGDIRVVDPEFRAREELLPLHEHLADVDTMTAAALRVPGVRSAWPRISMGVTLTVGDQIGDTFALVMGAPPRWYTEEQGAEENLIAGRLIGEDGRGVVMGRVLVKNLGAKLGDRVLLLGQTQDGAMAPVEEELIGILSAGSATIDQVAFLSLERVQWMADVEGGATELLLYVDDLERTEEVAAALEGAPELAGAVVEPWDKREMIAQILGMVTVIQGVMSSIIVLVCAMGVWNTMMMSVRERTGEIGVLRAMGMGRLGVVRLFVLEGVLIALIGGVIGVGIGGLGGLALEVWGIEIGDQASQNVEMPFSSQLYGDMTLDIALQALAMAVMMALVGTAVPAISAVRVQPIEAMRHRT